MTSNHLEETPGESFDAFPLYLKLNKLKLGIEKLPNRHMSISQKGNENTFLHLQVT